MIVGVPKEIKRDEYRVALLPVGVEELVRAVSYHYLGEQDGAPYVEDILGKLDFVLLRITPTAVVGFDGLD